MDNFHLRKEMRGHCVSSLDLAVLKYTQQITVATMYSGPNIYIKISAALAYHFLKTCYCYHNHGKISCKYLKSLYN